ncbi:unnamed protein product [Ambrosiozyma monospora]|uniref:Unnamed protein product n=1 Tax=Ambrosiozyma monospora TaxID=43982 RepID=A0ACB5T8K2_AMBMO|nr:unnamed protein product [Ambrosiozyma monospora]
MGLDYDSVKSVVEKTTTNVKSADNVSVYLVAPVNAMLNFYKDEADNGLNFGWDEVWRYDWHYDMDHFEVDEFGFQTFTPGLGIYKITV